MTIMLNFGLLQPSADIHESKGRGLVLDINAQPYDSSFRTRRFRAGGWLAVIVAAFVVASSWMFRHERKVHHPAGASITSDSTKATPTVSSTASSLPTPRLSPAIFMEC